MQRTPNAPPRPFDGLDPQTLVDAVEALGLECDGRILALNSYENRVYRVGLEDAAPVVAKFYRPQRWKLEAILEEHAFAAELRAADLSVVAPLAIGGRTLHEHAGFRFALFPMQGGHAPELSGEHTLATLGRSLGRLHLVGEAGVFRHRERFDLAARAEAAADTLLDDGWLPPHLVPRMLDVCDDLLAVIETAQADAGETAILRLHGDCHPANLLWRDGTAHFVDLDDAASGAAVHDLWMLLSGSRAEQTRQLQVLLEGYETFRRFDRAELHLVGAARAVRLLHHNAWIARRWRDPAFPAAFADFEQQRHWEDFLDQLADLTEAAAAPPLRP
ncbi:serine/threonine protein kinase [Coralloluteibacterium thermophilus]|uniref:Stress response kinase A n=1 Tax=Coralloluteibacterium thermophilum TaxID=2707049 RepID=A0ABV9NJU6_9GAMM